MFRLVHTLLLAAVVAVALVSYGLKEEVGARREALAELRAQQTRLSAQIDTLRTEWRYLSSPQQLRAIAARLWRDGALRSADGVALRPWTASQLVDLHAPAAPPSTLTRASAETEGGVIETGTVRR